MDRKYKLLVYTNDLAINGHGALMVVPIPKVEGGSQLGVGLVNVNTIR